MRFLGIGDSCDLAALYLRLTQDQHEVRCFIADPDCHGTMAGMIPRIDDWHASLDWVHETNGIILFENVASARGELQDDLRRQNYRVIGGSAFGDRLENDRLFAQQLLASLELPIARSQSFTDVTAAVAFIEKNPARYVLKFNGPGFGSFENYVGELTDGADVSALLRTASLPPDTSFILMEHIDGIEMGVGAYFDGEKFLHPACLDWEHKRFFPGDRGELTGEMGTVVTYARSKAFFAATLAKLAPILRDYNHHGYVNLNTIVNAQGIWPLEFTCRFGYPGFAILSSLQQIKWAELLRLMVEGDGDHFQVRNGFAVGIVLTTPPFPYKRKQVKIPIGLPVLFDKSWDKPDEAEFYPGEVGRVGDGLVTSGIYGWTGVVTGCGATIAEANQSAYARAAKIFVPNLRYRHDIGDKLINGDFAELERLGLLDTVNSEL